MSGTLQVMMGGGGDPLVKLPVGVGVVGRPDPSRPLVAIVNGDLLLRLVPPQLVVAGARSWLHIDTRFSTHSAVRLLESALFALLSM